jgi:hypothetical protein
MSKLPRFSASLALGVGHLRAETASISVPPSRPFLGVIRPPFDPRQAVGVGQYSGVFICWAKLLPLIASVILPPRELSEALGVTHNPDALSQMGSSGIGRRYDTPFRIEPQRGQVSKNSSESPRSEHWAVFHFDSDGLYLANNPNHVGPQPTSLAIDAGSGSSSADVLAGKAARYDVNNSSPRSAVKSRNVRPNWESFENSIVLSLRQNLCGVSVTFNCAHGSASVELPSEYSSTSACEKSQLIQFFSFSFCRSAHFLLAASSFARLNRGQASLVSSWRRIRS